MVLLVNEEVVAQGALQVIVTLDQLRQSRCLKRASEKQRPPTKTCAKSIPPAETSVDSASVRKLSQMGMHGQRHPAIIDHEQIVQAQERTKLAQPKS